LRRSGTKSRSDNLRNLKDSPRDLDLVRPVADRVLDLPMVGLALVRRVTVLPTEVVDDPAVLGVAADPDGVREAFSVLIAMRPTTRALLDGF
jgi:hypothetical protein